MDIQINFFRSNLRGIKMRPLIAYPFILLPAAVGAEVPAETVMQSGKEIYEQSCIVCHGDDGSGGMPGVPDMTMKGGPLEKSNDLIARNIVDGFQSPESAMAMPPRGGNPELKNEQVDAVIVYMRHTFGIHERAR